MPSASSKLEKPAPTEAVDPLKQAIVVIGHKIRNLEKRKSKLDSYKESIKSLTKEQVEAVSKYDEVVQQLELSKEYVKQFTVISVENDKLKKKQAKKDAQDKYTAEVNKIKQMLLIQDVLHNMRSDNVRQDFLGGQNGAIQLTEADLKALDDLYAEISPKHYFENNQSSADENYQKAAEQFINVIEGKSKDLAGTTAVKIRDLLLAIHNCGYFDKTQREEVSSIAEKIETPNHEEEFFKSPEILNNVIIPTQSQLEGNQAPVPTTGPVQPIMPGGSIIPNAATQPPIMQPNSHPILPPNVPAIVPTPVSQVESSFFNAQGFKPPAPPTVPPSTQNTRQINDVIQSVAGKFNFLQESEIELPDINSVVVSGNPSLAGSQIPGGSANIPTQTFTNQNFNGQPGNGPPYPPNYPPQAAAFQTFVPAFPAFVPPNASPVQNANANPNPTNPVTVAPVNNSANSSISTNSSNINENSNKCNNIQNLIPNSINRNPNVNFNQGQQQISSGFTSQQNKQNLSHMVGQSTFPHGNMPVGSVDNSKIEDAVRGESDKKEKQENEKQDWSQTESTNWADDWTETTEWNSINQNQFDGNSNSNKFSSNRPSRNSGISRNTSYQGSRNRSSRSGGYRDSQNNQGGSSNFYQNQNDYPSRNDRNNEYSVGKGADLRENAYKERGDYSNRERDNYGGGFKRGPNNRVPNAKGSMDRGDKSQMQQTPRSNNNIGPRGVPRNMNRQPGGRPGGSSFQRQQQNPVSSSSAK